MMAAHGSFALALREGEAFVHVTPPTFSSCRDTHTLGHFRSHPLRKQEWKFTLLELVYVPFGVPGRVSDDRRL